MKRKWWYVGLISAVFLSGFIAGLNVRSLRPSPHYDAAWWKVVVAVLFTIFLAVMYYQRSKKR
jgi:hypothetical protein